MILEVIFTIVGYLLTVILTIVNTIFTTTEWFVGIPLASWTGYVFGNIYLLNDILPVTEAFTLAVLALNLKIAVFTFKMYFFVTGLLNHLRYTFFSIRL